METNTAAGDLGIAARLSRSRGRAGRDQNTNAKLTIGELEELKAAAKASGKALGEWNREVLLSEARRGQEGRAVFTELIALRLLLNNALRSLLQGKTMSDAEIVRMQAEVKTSKHAVASDVLTQYQNSDGGH